MYVKVNFIGCTWCLVCFISYNQAEWSNCKARHWQSKLSYLIVSITAKPYIPHAQVMPPMPCSADCQQFSSPMPTIFL